MKKAKAQLENVRDLVHARKIAWANLDAAVEAFLANRDCQEFRVGAAIVDPKEVPDGTTQSTPRP